MYLTSCIWVEQWIGQVLSRRGVLFLSVLLIFISTSPRVFAHAQLVKSTPSAKAELNKAPTSLELWFNELLEDGFNSIQVFPTKQLKEKKRDNLVDGKPILDTKDRTHLSIRLQSLPPEDYTVEWRVLSRDGHSAPGRFSFRILPSK